MTIELNEDNFSDTINTGITLVDFWAEWCGPCKAAAPYVDKLADQVGDNAKVVKVNVDESPSIASEFGVMSIPTFILFKDGEVIERTSGFTPNFIAEWTEKIDSALL
ncbi:thioredoxin [bacterium]|nr:thioredoxin [bacterium]|tara:strand:+ start:15232 stop:15552 length:321 start_codon:yes stop_codon:yes gene_type:complete